MHIWYWALFLKCFYFTGMKVLFLLSAIFSYKHIIFKAKYFCPLLNMLQFGSEQEAFLPLGPIWLCVFKKEYNKKTVQVILNEFDLNLSLSWDVQSCFFFSHSFDRYKVYCVADGKISYDWLRQGVNSTAKQEREVELSKWQSGYRLIEDVYVQACT